MEGGLDSFRKQLDEKEKKNKVIKMEEIDDIEREENSFSSIESDTESGVFDFDYDELILLIPVVVPIISKMIGRFAFHRVLKHFLPELY
ncbi:hypothetical protein HDU92_001401 [Lobulomyces angularis]|nr:hypothetical protein HDU92_001401 [Lobulomyces angularis]